MELRLHLRREPELQFDLPLLPLDRDLLLLYQTPLFFKLRANFVPSTHPASFGKASVRAWTAGTWPSRRQREHTTAKATVLFDFAHSTWARPPICKGHYRF
jgi:hypothetical protein